jgi:predicted transcriptional regulator
MSGRTLLLSLRPEFAEKVFAGTKKVELRRIRPRIQIQDWVLVYVSTPVQAVVGAFQVAEVVENSPAALWKKVREHAGITRRQFDDYYLGAPKGYGIFLSAVKVLPEPVKLSHLRMVLPDFHPPQCYRYLDLYEARLIKCYRNK